MVILTKDELDARLEQARAEARVALRDRADYLYRRCTAPTNWDAVRTFIKRLFNEEEHK